MFAKVPAAQMFVPTCKDACRKCFKEAEATTTIMQDIQDPYLKNNPTHTKWAGRVAQVVEQA
jgi:hypothetical protein